MAEYGVPDTIDGVLPWSWAEERLVANRNYWVVTADASGRPHAMPVWGVWLDDGLVFSCATSARKARNISANPRVVITVDDTVEVVSVEGTAATVDDASTRQRVGEIYAAKYEPDPTKQEEMIGFVTGHGMFRVTPERAFGIIEREEDFAARATRWVW